jgi:hypothetical protein
MSENMFRKEPQEILSKTAPSYIEKVGGLNNVTALAQYLGTLKTLDKSDSIEFVYLNPFEFPNTEELKTKFMNYIDAAIESLIDSKEPKFNTVSGDSDHIRDKKRQERYKKATSHGVEITSLMDIKSIWTMENAELLESCGVNVRHNNVQEDYHFATWADTMMYTFYREPVDKGVRKVVSEPQEGETLEKMRYWFLATNQPDFVEYTNNLWKDLLRKSSSLEDRKKRLNINRQNEFLNTLSRSS